MIKLPIDPYWTQVQSTFMKRRDQWAMESENVSNEMALWLAEQYGAMIRGRKHLYFVFNTEREAEYFVLVFGESDG